MPKRSVVAAVISVLLCVGPAVAAGDGPADQGESLVSSICRLVNSSARAQGLPVSFLTRLIWQESNFRPNVSSPAGAQGVAQFMPGTAGERGLVDPFDPEAAIPKAASLLAELRQRFGNLGLAAAAYNAGPARVAKWLAEGGELPLETQNYVSTIPGIPSTNGPRAPPRSWKRTRSFRMRLACRTSPSPIVRNTR